MHLIDVYTFDHCGDILPSPHRHTHIYLYTPFEQEESVSVLIIPVMAELQKNTKPEL